LNSGSERIFNGRHLVFSGTGTPYLGEGDGYVRKRSEKEFHNLSFSLCLSSTKNY